MKDDVGIVEMMYRKVRKLLTQYGTQHPRVEITRMYLNRDTSGKGLLGCGKLFIGRNKRPAAIFT